MTANKNSVFFSQVSRSGSGDLTPFFLRSTQTGEVSVDIVIIIIPWSSGLFRTFPLSDLSSELAPWLYERANRFDGGGEVLGKKLSPSAVSSANTVRTFPDEPSWLFVLFRYCTTAPGQEFEVFALSLELVEVLEFTELASVAIVDRVLVLKEQFWSWVHGKRRENMGRVRIFFLDEDGEREEDIRWA